MLEQGVRGDFAIIAKPGWSVAWEEVGLCWFKVIVRGDLNYTGVRHVVKGRNPVVHAAKVIGSLEEWFTEYTEKNTSGRVAPQGSINAIQAGWPDKLAFQISSPRCRSWTLAVDSSARSSTTRQKL